VEIDYGEGVLIPWALSKDEVNLNTGIKIKGMLHSIFLFKAIFILLESIFDGILLKNLLGRGLVGICICI
jgi:hypothetical protein